MSVFLPINLIVCFRCSKGPSHLDGSFEYPQHMFWVRNEENRFPVRTLIWRPGYVFFYDWESNNENGLSFTPLRTSRLQDKFLLSLNW